MRTAFDSILGQVDAPAKNEGWPGDTDERSSNRKRNRDREPDTDDRERRGKRPTIDTGIRILHAFVAFFFGVLGAHKLLQGNYLNAMLRLLIGMGPFTVAIVAFALNRNANPPTALACMVVLGMPLVAFASFIESIKYVAMSNESYAREYLVEKRGWF